MMDVSVIAFIFFGIDIFKAHANSEATTFPKLAEPSVAVLIVFDRPVQSAEVRALGLRVYDVSGRRVKATATPSQISQLKDRPDVKSIRYPAPSPSLIDEP